MSESPLAAWCRWFERLPPELADDLGAAIGAMFPGRLLAMPRGERPSLSLVARVDALAGDPNATAGLCLTLTALTDSIVSDRTDPARWNDTAALLNVLDQAADAVLDEADAVGELVEHARLRSPLWARQWKVQQESWSAARRGALAAEAIARWLRSARLATLST